MAVISSVPIAALADRERSVRRTSWPLSRNLIADNPAGQRTGRLKGTSAMDASPTPNPPPPQWPPVPYPAPPRGAHSGLAIASFVLSLVALVGVVFIGLVPFLGAAIFASSDPFMEDMGSPVPATGELPPGHEGGRLEGADLSAAIADLTEQSIGDVTELKCPNTPAVDQGVVTVCHGSLFGEPMSLIVIFENKQGRFTLDTVWP
jgi:hypothetical protein